MHKHPAPAQAPGLRKPQKSDISLVATCCMVRECRMTFQMLVIHSSFNVELMSNYLRNALHLLLFKSFPLVCPWRCNMFKNGPISPIMFPAMCQLFGLSASLTCTTFQLSCGWERARKFNTSAVSTPHHVQCVRHRRHCVHLCCMCNWYNVYWMCCVHRIACTIQARVVCIGHTVLYRTVCTMCTVCVALQWMHCARTPPGFTNNRKLQLPNKFRSFWY